MKTSMIQARPRARTSPKIRSRNISNVNRNRSPTVAGPLDFFPTRRRRGAVHNTRAAAVARQIKLQQEDIYRLTEQLDEHQQRLEEREKLLAQTQTQTQRRSATATSFPEIQD